MNISEIKQAVASSPFNRYSDDREIPWFNPVDSLLFYINENAPQTADSVFKYGVPEFQRSNDKWSREMQVSFVENVVLGLRTTLMLFTLKHLQKHGKFANCFILDGLQRITALVEFQSGEFKIFDDSVSYNDLINNRVITRGSNHRATVRIYTFDHVSEVVEFYIAMNRNITHSSEDIEKAEKYLENLRQSSNRKV